ncbi:MAG: hypothetical protein CMM47_05820 [Rhodospirillaceae bacterium]|nr:hypothetical protein [Rhodospirillaceae bacterium]
MEIDVNLSLGRLDLDSLTLNDQKTEAPSKGTAFGSLLEPGREGSFTLPDDVRVKLVFSADVFHFRGRAVRQLKLEAVLDQGAVDVSVATAQLPGGTNVTVTGALRVEGGVPRFAGRADVVSDNLRAALEWIGAPLDGLAADRLRKGTLGTDLDVSRTKLQLTNWITVIDGTEVAGGLTLLFKDRPAFGLRVVADKINVDAYLPRVTEGKQQATVSAVGDYSKAKTNEIITRILASFDANIILEIAEARFRETLFRGLVLDTTVQSGKIAVKNFVIKDVGGASVTASGELAGTLVDPTTALDFEIEAPSATQIAKLAGLEFNGTLQRLGEFRLTSKIMGSLNFLTLNSQLAIAGGEVVVRGKVKPLEKPPGIDLALKADHLKIENILSVLVNDRRLESYDLGPGSLAVTIATTPDGNLDFDSTLAVANGQLTFAGRVDPLADNMSVDGKVSFQHPDVVRLIRVAAPGYKPMKRDLGSAKLGFRISGNAGAVNLDGVSFAAGPIRLDGSARMLLSGARPRLDADFAANEINLTKWIPVASVRRAGNVSAIPIRTDGREWSRKKIDLSLLRAVDGSLKLAVNRLVHGLNVVDDFSVKSILSAGVLSVPDLSGRMFGGQVLGTGRLVSDDPPWAEMFLKVEQVDLRAATEATSGTKTISGILDYEASLSTQGVSEYELVAALDGEGRFLVRHGEVLLGLDLPALSRELKTLNRAVDFVILAQKALNDGSTPIESLSGTYTIEKGVLRSNDIVVASPVAVGKTVALAHLPNQEIDISSRFWLTEHPNSPPVGVRNVGPMANPRIVLDVKKMQAYLLQRVVQRGILREFTDTKKTPATPIAPVQKGGKLAPPDKIEPKDALKAILRGLLK